MDLLSYTQYFYQIYHLGSYKIPNSLEWDPEIFLRLTRKCCGKQGKAMGALPLLWLITHFITTKC